MPKNIYNIYIHIYIIYTYIIIVITAYKIKLYHLHCPKTLT